MNNISTNRLVDMVRGYKDNDKDNGEDLIETSQILNIISRECWKYINSHDLDDLEQTAKEVMLNLIKNDLTILPNANDGQIISYINKVFPGRFIDALTFNNNEYLDLDSPLPGTDIPLVETLVSHQPNPEELFIDKERSRELAAAVKKLTPKQQLVVAMYYYDGYTQEEIAVKLNISQQAVSRIHERAIDMLKSVMKNV